ncbi:MAG: hypothetical protein JO180_07135 [Gemmatirosa sp.]|nr:hypothetical protein [Gemmatirosa sp.]
MINRLTLHVDRQPDEEPYGDFHVVSGPFGALSITAETARAIAQALDRRRPPRWLAFRDRAGSHIRIRTRDVRAICESTAEQRAYDRRMARARDREERAERPSWDDD